jgi:hypothetical protein
MNKMFTNLKLGVLASLFVVCNTIVLAEVKENEGCKYTEIKYPDGQYKGTLRNGKKDGWGIFEYSTGRRYEGEWVNGKRHGVGILFFSDGNIWKGEWKNGEQNGRGVLIFADRGVFSGGTWKNNELVKDSLLTKLTKKDKDEFASVVDGLVRESKEKSSSTTNQLSPCSPDKLDSQERLTKVLKEKGIDF